MTNPQTQDLQTAYAQKLEARLDRWNAELVKLEARASEAEADAKIEYRKKIDEMKSQRDAIQKKLGDMKDAGANAWNEIRDGIDEAWSALQKSFEKAKVELS